jgi:hypothetical protein
MPSSSGWASTGEQRLLLLQFNEGASLCCSLVAHRLVVVENWQWGAAVVPTRGGTQQMTGC